FAVQVVGLDAEPVHRVEGPDDKEVVRVGRREPAPLHPVLEAMEVSDDRADDAVDPRRLVGRDLVPVQVPLPSPLLPPRLTVPLARPSSRPRDEPRRGDESNEGDTRQNAEEAAEQIPAHECGERVLPPDPLHAANPAAAPDRAASTTFTVTTSATGDSNGR